MRHYTLSHRSGARETWPLRSSRKAPWEHTSARSRWHYADGTRIPYWKTPSRPDSKSSLSGNGDSRHPKTSNLSCTTWRGWEHYRHLSRNATAFKSRPSAGWPAGKNSPESGQPWTTSRRWGSTGFTGPGAESFSRWAWPSPCASGSVTWLRYGGVGSNTLDGLSSSTTRSTRQWLPNQSHRFGSPPCPQHPAEALQLPS